MNLGQLVGVMDLEGVEFGVGAGGVRQQPALALRVEEAEAAHAGVGQRGGEVALAGAGRASHGHHQALVLEAAT